MRQVWGSACKGAQNQLESEREALSAARKEIERERAEMLAEISRLDGELDAARTGTQERDQALDEARRSHEETRAERREARVLVEERSRRIDEQAADLQEARRHSSEALAQSKRLEADLAHLNQELGEAKQRADQEAKARTKLAGELARAQTDNRRRSSFSLDEVGLVSEPSWSPRWRLLSGSLGARFRVNSRAGRGLINRLQAQPEKAWNSLLAVGIEADERRPLRHGLSVRPIRTTRFRCPVERSASISAVHGSPVPSHRVRTRQRTDRSESLVERDSAPRQRPVEGHGEEDLGRNALENELRAVLEPESSVILRMPHQAAAARLHALKPRQAFTHQGLADPSALNLGQDRNRAKSVPIPCAVR